MNALDRMRAAIVNPAESPENRTEDHAILLAAVSPLVPGDWLPIPPERARPILRGLGDALGHPDRTVVRVRSLPFFPGWFLLETVEWERDSNVCVRLALLGETEVVVLEGNMEPVHRVRQIAFAPIDEEGMLDYLRFFTTACRGEKGRFHVITAPADLSPGEVLAPGARDLFQSALLEPILVERTQAGCGIRVRILYGANLFDAEFMVPRNGACEMREDQLLLEGALETVERWNRETLSLQLKMETSHGG